MKRFGELTFAVGFAMLLWACGFGAGQWWERQKQSRKLTTPIPPAAGMMVCTFDNDGKNGNYVIPSFDDQGRCHATPVIRNGYEVVGLLRSDVKANGIAPVEIFTGEVISGDHSPVIQNNQGTEIK